MTSGALLDERGVPYIYSEFSDVFSPKTKKLPLPPHRDSDLTTFRIPPSII